MVSETNRTSGGPSTWGDLRAAYSVAFGRPVAIGQLTAPQLLGVWVMRLFYWLIAWGVSASLVLEIVFGDGDAGNAAFFTLLFAYPVLLAVTFVRDITYYLVRRRHIGASAPPVDGEMVFLYGVSDALSLLPNLYGKYKAPMSARSRRLGYAMLAGWLAALPLLASPLALALLITSGNWSLASILVSWGASSLLLHTCATWFIRPDGTVRPA